ncbi:cytochrome b6 [Geotalea uraniireducens]|uniref:Cytochrome c peroxidase-like protein n=1 Tax=Geotalea uraniireducens (strain Rf4) TaxID=351605 RepID=A5G8U4_GEOUR|nr:cytochrome b6 [Geotalea uraniireducens]ABQ28212.1 Cytochrome c peroxidase-like protein [Geotalea uraniireducens Rf4]
MSGKKQRYIRIASLVTAGAALATVTATLAASDRPVGTTSYAPVADTTPFASVRQTMEKAKPAVMQRQLELLSERYDLGDKPLAGVKMSRGKSVQEGVRVKLPKEVSWQQLAAMGSEQIRNKDLFPKGFMPLPHPNHPEGGMLFPKFHIDEIRKQTGRDLTRFDLDFDLPNHVLPEFPPAIFLTTRPDLGDVSQGKVVTTQNFFELFNGILNPKQLEGLRLLLTPFPQQQFNATSDRRSAEPSLGVSCFDCHVNGHTNGATHLVGDIRPQELRHRLDTPPLRGVNIQRLFGSQRALKSVEDFTEFEQRAAYFDGDPVIATKKGVNILERGSQVHFMAEFQELLDFPPAPKLDLFGKLDPAKASESELRGQTVFFGKARCAECHPAPYYTDNLMHNLKVERFYKPQLINGRLASADGPIKTFPLRGIKESPPYLHDGRLLTLADTIEFFNLVTGVNLTEEEKKDLLAFMLTL